MGRYWTLAKLRACAEGVAGFVFIFKKSKTPIFIFSFHRAEILSGFINSLALMVISVSITLNALARIHQPPDINTDRLMVSASSSDNQLSASTLLRLEPRVKTRQRPNGERRTRDVYCGLQLSQVRLNRRGGNSIG